MWISDVGERAAQAISTAETMLGVRITIHDLAGHFRLLCPTSLVNRFWHAHPYCDFGRNALPAWSGNCVAHCQYKVNAEVREGRVPIVHHCWKGGAEVVVPLFREGVHVGTFFAGVFRSSTTPAPAELTARADELPALTSDHAAHIAGVLHFLGQGILNELDQYHPSPGRDQDRKSMIRRFIHYHAHEPVRLRDLAANLCLSPSRAGHLITNLFQASFQDLLLTERLQRVCCFLESTDFNLETIASRTGFANHYYLSRQFRKRFGTSPGAWRREHRQAQA